MLADSIFYSICCKPQCKESGNIKKNCSKCHKCRNSLIKLSLELLNNFYCPQGDKCNLKNCNLCHPTKKHRSPPFISPCIHGIHCINIQCLFLHPEINSGCWTVRLCI
jgi:hypothetical protein